MGGFKWSMGGFKWSMGSMSLRVADITSSAACYGNPGSEGSHVM